MGTYSVGGVTTNTEYRRTQPIGMELLKALRDGRLLI